MFDYLMSGEEPEAPAQEESRTPREVDYSAIYSLFNNKNNDNLPS